jgi:hypothetical protein
MSSPSREINGLGGGASQHDKLRHGPCAEPFAQLQLCKERKQIIKASNALTFCVSETDVLIQCVRKNPAWFHESSMKK